MWKACPRCGKIHDSKYKCNANRTNYDSEERRLRNKYSWAKKSKQMRQEKLFCAVCQDEGRYTYQGLEVHHIEKLRNAPNRLLDESNLIVLCSMHHKQADSGELSEEYLRSLIDG